MDKNHTKDINNKKEHTTHIPNIMNDLKSIHLNERSQKHKGPYMIPFVCSIRTDRTMVLEAECGPLCNGREELA